MNSLNSVLIEGNLTADPIERDGICRFKIESNRYHKQDNEHQRETICVPIEITGGMADRCMEYLKENSSVRVVGRIKQDGDKLIIYAEHVEFK